MSQPPCEAQTSAQPLRIATWKLEVIARIEAGTITREPLDLSKGSYYGWPTREAYAEFRARGRRLW